MPLGGMQNGTVLRGNGIQGAEENWGKNGGTVFGEAGIGGFYSITIKQVKLFNSPTFRVLMQGWVGSRGSKLQLRGADATRAAWHTPMYIVYIYTCVLYRICLILPNTSI